MNTICFKGLDTFYQIQPSSPELVEGKKESKTRIMK